MQEVTEKYGKKNSEVIKEKSAEYIRYGKLTEQNGKIKLTKEGMLISDAIMTDFIII